MHPSYHAKTRPDHPAVIMAGSGERMSFDELDRRSNQAAHLFRAIGCDVGDRVAILLENQPRLFEIAWGAQRAGLYLVGISTQLTPAEVDYIVQDSGARVLVTSPRYSKSASMLAGLDMFLLGGEADGERFRSWDREVAQFSETPIPDERAGTDMLYSSGTTGRPKGVKPALPDDPAITGHTPVSQIAADLLGFDEKTIYLSPTPLYHAAPLRFSMAAHRLGGTVIVMEKFDPEHALALIDKHRVTHSQWVPTHFVRMLRLDDDVKLSFDLSSHKSAVHAAAPCPVPVKEQMIDWWGPIIVEYYAGTEGNGLTLINARDWLTHKGSVGTAVVGTPRICGPDGEVLPAGREGLIYFENGNSFSYHNDPEKTASSMNAKGWTTLGDIGWLDEDGFLYLTDRESFMIISGGVNVYPQEIENLLLSHPKVLDAAVIGIPDPDMGEKVTAVIQPVDWNDAGDVFRQELDGWMRQRLSGVKLPRKIDFLVELPRHATGKLYKRLLKDRYWNQTA